MFDKSAKLQVHAKLTKASANLKQSTQQGSAPDHTVRSFRASFRRRVSLVVRPIYFLVKILHQIGCPVYEAECYEAD